MTDFWLYFKQGVNHVFDFSAYEHLLFIIVLVAAYAAKKWKRILGLISIFTIGHSVSLLLGAYHVLQIDTQIIEFIIALSIVFMAFYNILTASKDRSSSSPVFLYLLILFFGLAHGFSFASHFNLLSNKTSDFLINLVGFALGIDASQLVIIILTLLLSAIFQNLLRYSKRDWILIISSLILGLALPIFIKNWIF